MIYTKNEIVMEATLYGDIARIQVATNMMYEHYVDMMESAIVDDDENMMEAAEDGVKKSIAEMFSSVIDRIKEFIQNKIETVKRRLAIKKLSDIGIKLSNTEIDKIMKNTPPDKKVMCVDVDRVLALLDRAEKGANAFIDRVVKETEKMGDMRFVDMMKAKKHLKEFIEEGKKPIDEIFRQIKEVMKKENQMEVSISKYLKSVAKMQEAANRLDSLDRMMNDAGARLKNGFIEAAEREERLKQMEKTELRNYRMKDQMNRMKAQKSMPGFESTLDDLLDDYDGYMEERAKKPKTFKEQAVATLKSIASTAIGALVYWGTLMAVILSQLLIYVGAAVAVGGPLYAVIHPSKSNAKKGAIALVAGSGAYTGGTLLSKSLGID